MSQRGRDHNKFSMSRCKYNNFKVSKRARKRARRARNNQSRQPPANSSTNPPRNSPINLNFQGYQPPVQNYYPQNNHHLNNHPQSNHHSNNYPQSNHHSNNYPQNNLNQNNGHNQNNGNNFSSAYATMAHADAIRLQQMRQFDQHMARSLNAFQDMMNRAYRELELRMRRLQRPQAMDVDEDEKTSDPISLSNGVITINLNVPKKN